MAQIPEALGAGGAHITPFDSPSLVEILDDIAADLDALQPATVAAANTVAVTATVIDPVATADASDPATTQALANANKAKVNELVTRVNALTGTVNTLVTLANELKSRVNAPAAVTIRTIASDA